MMVTLVPPDSGPLLGDRPVTVGVCETDKRDFEPTEDKKMDILSNQRLQHLLKTFRCYHISPAKLQLFILPG